jgi:carbon-monoxide dehydrogenase medium subunit
VKPAPFAYAKARSLDHAIELLGQDGAKLLAGGQSLIATLNMRLSSPRILIDINGVEALKGVSVKDGQITIGALVRHAEAERSGDVARHAPLIAAAMPHIGHPPIRNRGTIGGSIAFADPAAELPACLLALDADIAITGPDGARTVKADKFFKALFETALAAGDVLTAIRVPAASPKMRYGFAEFARRHGDYALLGLAASARAETGGLADVRLAFFGVGPTPRRAVKAEAALAGGVDGRKVDAAIAALAGDLDPPDDMQGSGVFKKHLAGVLLRRVADQLAETTA